MELFSLLGIHFERVITLFSTAALTLPKGTEIDFYGTTIHPKILDYFGNMEYIMPTNAWLSEKGVEMR